MSNHVEQGMERELPLPVSRTAKLALGWFPLLRQTNPEKQAPITQVKFPL